MASQRNLFGSKHSSSKPERNADFAGSAPMRHLTLNHPPSQTCSGLSHPLTVSHGLSGDLQMAGFDLIFILSIHLYPIRAFYHLSSVRQRSTYLPHTSLLHGLILVEASGCLQGHQTVYLVGTAECTRALTFSPRMSFVVVLVSGHPTIPCSIIIPSFRC